MEGRERALMARRAVVAGTMVLCLGLACVVAFHPETQRRVELTSLSQAIKLLTNDGAVAAGSRSRAAANSKDALEGDITRLETALSDALAIKGQRGTIEISAEPHARNAAMSRIHAKHASEHGREVQWGRAPIPEADGSSSEDAHLIDQDSQRRRRSAMMMVTPEERQSQRETEEVMMGHGAEEKDPSLAISEPVLDGAADDVAAVSPSSLSMGGPREGGRGGSEMRLARAQRAKGDGIRSEVEHERMKLEHDYAKKEAAMRRIQAMFLKEDNALKGEIRQLDAHRRPHRDFHGALDMDERESRRKPHHPHGARGIDGGDNQQLRVYPYSGSMRSSFSSARDRAVDGPLETPILAKSDGSRVTWPARPHRSPLEQGAYRDNTIYDGDYNWPSLSEVSRGDEWKQTGNCGLWGGNC